MATEKNSEVKNGENGLTVKLTKPYSFEGTEYQEVDLSGLEKLTIRDAVDAQRKLVGEQEVATLLLSETTTAFLREIAVRACGLPAEFFKLMPRAVWQNVKRAVQAYLNGGEKATEHHYLTFEAAHSYKGKLYEGVDLNKVAELTTMHESRAENRLTQEGFLITETSGNYLFACVLAGMATGLEEEFFTSLPLRELLKLKQAVNDSDFFA